MQGETTSRDTAADQQVGWIVVGEAWHLTCAPTVERLAAHYGFTPPAEVLTHAELAAAGDGLFCTGCGQPIAS